MTFKVDTVPLFNDSSVNAAEREPTPAPGSRSFISPLRFVNNEAINLQIGADVKY
ncbi:hypothetical protein D3C80_1149700 [compost metagenome]